MLIRIHVKKQRAQVKVIIWTKILYGYTFHSFLYLKSNCLKQYHIIYCCESSSCSVMSDSWQPHDCSLPGSSVHGILQARIPERLAIPFSRGSSWLRDWTRVSCIAGRFFTVWATREAQLLLGQQHMACNVLAVAAQRRWFGAKLY